MASTYVKKLLDCATQCLASYVLRVEPTGLVTHDIFDGVQKTEPFTRFIVDLFYDCGDQVAPETFEEEILVEDMLHDRVPYGELWEAFKTIVLKDKL